MLHSEIKCFFRCFRLRRGLLDRLLFGCLTGGELKLLLATAGLTQRVFHRAVNCIKHIIFPGKAHLCFSGVHVHIHQLCRHIQHQHTARELALHQGSPVGVLHGSHHGAVLYEPPVDEEELHAPAGSAGSRRSDQAGHGIVAHAAFYRQKVPGKLLAQHRIDCTAQISVAGSLVKQFTFTDERHAHLRVRQGNSADRLAHEGTFAGILLQKFHPGGCIVKKIPYRDGGTNGPCPRLHTKLLTALDAVAACKFVRLGAGKHLHPGHTGNGGKCLAAEAQGVDAFQILLGLNLTGGMANKGSGNVLRLDAAAVVRHLDQRNAAPFNGDRNLRGSGINGILQQFLYYGSRPLHHLTGGDQLCGMLVQNMYDRQIRSPP